MYTQCVSYTQRIWQLKNKKIKAFLKWYKIGSYEKDFNQLN